MIKNKKWSLIPQNILFVFLTISGIFILNSCTKISIQNDDHTPIDASKTFFTLPMGTKKIVEKVAAQMKKLNLANEFINEFAVQEGYAVWNKVIINKNYARLPSQSFIGNNLGGSNDSTVIIPLVLNNTDYVNSYRRIR